MANSAGVGSATGSSGGTTALAVTLNGCTSGRQLLIGTLWESATATISSITVSGESNATVHASPLRTTDSQLSTLQLASLANITASGNKTVTVNFSASVACAIVVQESQGGDTAAFYTGTEASGQLDEQDDGNISFGITTPNANDMVWGVVVAPSSDPAFTGLTTVLMTDVFRYNAAYVQYDAGAAGAKTYPGVVVAFGIWAWKFAAFKSAGAAAAVSLPPINRGARAAARLSF